MNKTDLIKQAYDQFSQFEKPLHSTDFNHCGECFEYDQLLQNVIREELSIEDIGTVCWGPVPFLLPEAMAYYMPRFIELALENVETKDYSPYITQFINQIGNNPNKKCFSLFTSKHKELVYFTYKFINDNFREIVEEHCWEKDLDQALSGWRA